MDLDLDAAPRGDCLRDGLGEGTGDVVGILLTIEEPVSIACLVPATRLDPLLHDFSWSSSENAE